MGGRVSGSLGGQLQYKPTGFILDSDPGTRLAFVFSRRVLKVFSRLCSSVRPLKVRRGRILLRVNR